MSIYLCEICDNIRDSDYREIRETKTGLVCLECFEERTMSVKGLERESFEKRRYGGEVYEQD